MEEVVANNRQPETEVDSIFTDRWSPRAFSPTPIDERAIGALFEAARWAPSCFNEQPWLFLYATVEEDRARFAKALVEKNRQWASRAPMLVFVLSRLSFAASGRQNRHALFDAGAAWMSLALQARRLGMYAHAMAGFDRRKAREILKVTDEDYEIIAAVAVGYHGRSSDLPEDLAAAESPNDRKPHGQVCREGSFGG